MLVSKPTHGGGAPLGIDLEAGIATIKIVRPAPAPAVGEPPAENQPAATDPTEPSQDTEDQD